MQITVLTATIPGRERLLADALASVYAQTLAPYVHLISAQAPDAIGPAHVASQRNRLLASVETDWVAVLNDDDLWLPHHLERLAAATTGADVVYGWETSNFIPRADLNDQSVEQVAAMFAHSNCVDASSAIVRASLLRSVGGWPTEWLGGHWQNGGRFADMVADRDDWGLWHRLAQAGGRFRCVPEETWTYRAGDWPRDSTDLKDAA